MDQLPFQIISFGLLLNTWALFQYLRNRGGSRRITDFISPGGFILFAILVLIVGAIFMAALGPTGILLGMSLALGITMSFISPVVAVSFLIANLIIRPWEYIPTNSVIAIVPKLLAGLTLLSWLVDMIRRRRFTIVWNTPCTFFFCFLCWLFLSALFSGDYSGNFQYLFDTFFPFTIICILVVNSVVEKGDLEPLRTSLIIGVVSVIAAALVGFFTSPDYGNVGHRLEGVGLAGNANDLASLIALVVPFILFPLLLRRKGLGIHIIGYASLLILMVGLWASQSRGAISSLSICGIIYFLMFSKKSKGKQVLILLLLLVVPLVLFKTIDRDPGDLQGSSTSRWNYVVTGFRMAYHSPVFGVGPRGYERLYDSYTTVWDEYGERTAHSSWVLAMSEAGFMGLFLFVGLFVSTLRFAWRLRKIRPEYFLVMVSYGVAMSFLSHMYLLFPYLLYALVLAAWKVFKAELTTKEVAASILAGICVLLPMRSEALSLDGVRGGDKPIGDYLPDMDSKLLLSGSRGETLNFMVRARNLIKCEKITSDPLKSTEGGVLDASLHLFSMKTINVTQSSFPGSPLGGLFDPLIPVRNGEICPDSSVEHWYWGDIVIAREALPGDFSSAIIVGDRSIPLNVRVWKMVIPERFALPAYFGLAPYGLVLGHFGRADPSEAALTAKYREALIQHRALPLSTVISNLPIIKQNGHTSVDLDYADKPDGSFRAVNLRDLPSWGYYEFPKSEIQNKNFNLEKAKIWFAALENTAKEIDRPARAIINIWDEPKKDEMPLVRALAGLSKLLAPSIRTTLTVGYDPELKDLIDIFIPVINELTPKNIPIYRALHTAGRESWAYVSCMSHGCDASVDTRRPDMIIDRPSAYVRSISWMLMKFHMDGFLYYLTNYAYEFYPKRDPWDDVWDFSGNGDGTLFYPGRPGERGYTEHEPAPSIRLKLWREASFDAEYINWMETSSNKPDWWEEGYSDLIIDSERWERSYQKYQVLRDRAGEYLNSR